MLLHPLVCPRDMVSALRARPGASCHRPSRQRSSLYPPRLHFVTVLLLLVGGSMPLLQSVQYNSTVSSLPHSLFSAADPATKCGPVELKMNFLTFQPVLAQAEAVVKLQPSSR